MAIGSLCFWIGDGLDVKGQIGSIDDMTIFIIQVFIALVIAFLLGVLIGRLVKKALCKAAKRKEALQHQEEIIAKTPYVKSVMPTSDANVAIKGSGVVGNHYEAKRDYSSSTSLSMPDLEGESAVNNDKKIQHKLKQALRRGKRIKPDVTLLLVSDKAIDEWVEESAHSVTLGVGSFGKLTGVSCDVGKNGVVSVDGNVQSIENKQAILFHTFNILVYRDNFEYVFVQV